MATEPLRFAIIGTGAMGLEHIRNIKLLNNANVKKTLPLQIRRPCVIIYRLHAFF